MNEYRVLVTPALETDFPVVADVMEKIFTGWDLDTIDFATFKMANDGGNSVTVWLNQRKVYPHLFGMAAEFIAAQDAGNPPCTLLIVFRPIRDLICVREYCKTVYDVEGLEPINVLNDDFWIDKPLPPKQLPLIPAGKEETKWIQDVLPQTVDGVTQSLIQTYLDYLKQLEATKGQMGPDEYWNEVAKNTMTPDQYRHWRICQGLK